MSTAEFSSHSTTGVFEEVGKGADPQGMMAGGGRQTADTFSQPSACGDKASRPKASHQDLIERLARMEKEMSEKRVWSDSVDARLQFLESCHRQHAESDHYKMQETSNLDPPHQEESRSCQEAFTDDITQKELQKKEECEKLKEKIKELEARNKELSSEVMSMHEQSENMNDPSCLSAVLAMYDKLRQEEWKNLKASKLSLWTYKHAGRIIKQLFKFCEEEVQQRTGSIFEVLELPPSKHATIKGNQEIMEEIRKILKYSYYQNDSDFYFRMVTKAGIYTKNGFESFFTEQCCKIYCLLLLQDPPVKAEWKLPENSTQYLEHVERKGREFWTKISLLWPIMKCGERVIVKGVVWDGNM